MLSIFQMFLFFSTILLITTMFGIAIFYAFKKILNFKTTISYYIKGLILYNILQLGMNSFIQFAPGAYEFLYEHNFLSATLILISQITLFTLFVNSYVKQWYKSLICAIYALVVANCFHTLVDLIIIFVVRENNFSFNNTFGDYAGIIYSGFQHLCSTTFVILIFFSLAKLNILEKLKILWCSKRSALISSFIFVFTYLVYNALSMEFQLTYLETGISFSLPFILFFSYIVFVLSLSLIEDIRNKINEQLVLIAQQDINIKAISDAQLEIKTLRHDMKNIIASYTMQKASKNINELESYMKETNDTFDELLLSFQQEEMNTIDESKTFTSLLVHFSSPKQCMKSIVQIISNPMSLFLLFLVLFLLVFGFYTSSPYTLKNHAFILMVIVTTIFLLFFYLLLLTLSSYRYFGESEERLVALHIYYLDSLQHTQHALQELRNTFQKHYTQSMEANELLLLAMKATKALQSNSSASSVLTSLSNIQITRIYNLLLSKSSYMHANQLNYHIEVLKPIENINMVTQDLVRALGILIDNAIEETSQLQDGTINIVMLQEDDYVYINVNNPTKEESLNLQEIYQYGYSSKGNGRGEGLYSYRKILQRYAHISSNTKMKNNMFMQELYIQN